MLHVKDQIRYLRLTVLYILYDFCFSISLTDDVIFLEKLSWLSRI